MHTHIRYTYIRARAYFSIPSWALNFHHFVNASQQKTTRNIPLVKIGLITCFTKDMALLVDAWGMSERGC